MKKHLVDNWLRTCKAFMTRPDQRNLEDTFYEADYALYLDLNQDINEHIRVTKLLSKQVDDAIMQERATTRTVQVLFMGTVVHESTELAYAIDYCLKRWGQEWFDNSVSRVKGAISHSWIKGTLVTIKYA